MTGQNLEAFLARLYVDEKSRARFRANPRGEAQRAGLSDGEIRSLESIDWVGLELAARSFARKRRRKRQTFWTRWLRRAAGLWGWVKPFSEANGAGSRGDSP